MAGDWISVRVDLARCREVLVIARGSKRPRHEVAGLLVDFWAWASAETADGRIVDASVDALVDAVGADARFWECVISVGWLSIDGESLMIPKFDRWLSNGAKSRMMKSYRQKRWRAGKSDVDGNVDGNVDAGESTSSSTKEEKRREERGSARTRDNGNGDWESLTPFPKGFDRADVRAALRDWIGHLAAQKPILDVPLTASKAMQRYATPAEFIEAVGFAIANNRDFLGRPPVRAADIRNDDPGVDLK